MSQATIIVPCLDCPDLSRRAIISAVNQIGVEPLKVLVVDQGSTDDNRHALEDLAGSCPTIRLWRHAPPLPSLAATWNCALDYAWASGGKDALVINNDVELSMTYYQQLRERMKQDKLHFLSGVGVNPGQTVGLPAGKELTEAFQLHPDFSAFVITRLCHSKYRFDESYVPAYCEDQDFHRRMLLGNDGRKIGKINIPFQHYASGTLKQFSEAQRQMWSERITRGSRAYHQAKWGGEVNRETKIEPFGEDRPFDVSMDALRRVAENGDVVSGYLLMKELDAAVVYEPETPDGEPESAESEAGLDEPAF